MTSTTTTTTQVMIFAAREDAASGFARAKILSEQLRAINIPVMFVDRMASDLEALTLVAKHRVVMSPIVVVMRNGKASARRIGVPSVDDIVSYTR